MKEGIDSTAYNNEQGNRARKLFAAVVLAALDDAIADDKKFGNGPEIIARWARSKDGREVLTCAGIDPNERVVEGLMAFVGKGVRTSVALDPGDFIGVAHERTMRQDVAPDMRAASTNSRSRSDRTWPRMSRAWNTQPSTDRMKMIEPNRSQDGVSSSGATRRLSTTGMNAMMKIVDGKDSVRSMIRPTK